MAISSNWIQSTPHSIVDPIHGVMQFSTKERDALKPVIDSRLFQRLRQIKQLGMADLVFPGAVHTRFNHCIGVCYLVTRILRHVHDKEIDASFENYRRAMLAGLLHDIGHGPFSHAFEKFLRSSAGDQIEHEDWTKKFLKALRGEIKEISEDDANIINDYIEGNAKNPSVFSQVVSSQVDADRMDYLLRDSHFCGVSYGKFDLEWIIRCLGIIEIDSQPVLAVHKKGENTLEQFLIARGQMTRNIYYHRKIRTCEYLLQKLLLEITKLTAGEIDTISPTTSFSSFMKLAQRFIAGEMSKSQFLQKGFKSYKNLTEADVWAVCQELASKKLNDASTISSRLLSRNLPFAKIIDSRFVKSTGQYLNDLRTLKKVPSWQLDLVEVPFSYFKTTKKPVYIIRDSTSFYSYGSSGLISHLSDRNSGLHILIMDVGLRESVKKEVQKFLDEQHLVKQSTWGSKDATIKTA